MKSKAEVIQQLQAMGIKVCGNYVKKSDIVAALPKPGVVNLNPNQTVEPKKELIKKLHQDLKIGWELYNGGFGIILGHIVTKPTKDQLKEYKKIALSFFKQTITATWSDLPIGDKKSGGCSVHLSVQDHLFGEQASTSLYDGVAADEDIYLACIFYGNDEPELTQEDVETIKSTVKKITKIAMKNLKSFESKLTAAGIKNKITVKKLDALAALQIKSEALAEYSANRFKDIKGIEPGMKDIARMKDILTKANGDTAKMMALVNQMASAIKDVEKAQRRAAAALKILPKEIAEKAAQVFMAKF